MNSCTRMGLVTLLALSSTSLFAEGPVKDGMLDPPVGVVPKPSFEQLDVNRDGYIAKSELAQGHELSSLFAGLDSNNDGKLSSDEYAVYLEDLDEPAA